MASSEDRRLKPKNNEVRVRLYSQGVGDCFLLAFPADNERGVCYLAIDCGVALGTPERELRSRLIVEDLAAATGGILDILVITHQHFDHISSFKDNWREWQKIRVESLYLPWTERNAEKGEVKSKKKLEEVLKRAAEKALGMLGKEALAEQPILAAQAQFLGFTPGEVPQNLDDAMDFVRSLCRGQIRYFVPGDVFRLPGTGSHGYVLGPPLPHQTNAEGKAYIELLEDHEAMYSYADFGLVPDRGLVGGDRAFALSDDRAMPSLASGLLAVNSLDRAADEGFSPFACERRLDWDFAMATPFFRNHYGEKDERGENGQWRRVDGDWLAGISELALRAGDFTNNVSLVLAFDIPGSDKMLLFPGDAQVGNWLSWHQIERWSFVDGSLPPNPPRASDKKTLMENLLGRVAFYKVGHHGSHNATTKSHGLEMMTREDLVAFIPVSVPVAQDLMGYCPMPFYPVLRALLQRTQGRVFLPSGEAVEPAVGKVDHAALRAKSGIALSKDELPAKFVDGAEQEGKVPLYLELTLSAEAPA